MRNNLYFIAIIPPEIIRENIIAFQTDLRDNYNSAAALKVIPHITLKAPFQLPAEAHTSLLQWFRELYCATGIFTVTLNGFNMFNNKAHPVIFVQPVANASLFALQKEIVHNFHEHFPMIQVPDLELRFKPHITIGYRDLTPQQFTAAWKVYQAKPYNASFDVTGFHLLQHDTRQWNVIATYPV
ncbi:2'-5' RNA ligase family protein [Deminuibacter soli]|uniref:RNA 2',3'-cyclic phosphodiesterase n=1 Tax=Deminuibacter soli TaxID=2291815 RepID=A0A3E1NRF5_9BACT|nr:2'-5' RNA ligase family protein [Deminuibacter soli]RFM30526.1 RNA 2',3'-cyclic phosphodiesterase [Deminuibacter soli]